VAARPVKAALVTAETAETAEPAGGVRSLVVRGLAQRVDTAAMVAREARRKQGRLVTVD